MAVDVLLADRDGVLVAAYEAFLAAEGFRVAAVTTAADCLRELRSDPPRLLVLDPVLLRGDRGALARLAEAPDTPPVPVLVLTERPEDVLGELVPSRPAAVVIKPFAPAALASLVRSLGPSGRAGLTARRPTAGWLRQTLALGS
jgi:DNA-binding response OmpR family regulator